MVSVGWGALLTVYVVVFVDFMQLTFLFPLFPKVVQSIFPDVSPDDLGMHIGFLGSLSAVGEGVAAPYLGALADRVGRRPVFMLSTLCCAVCSVVSGLSGNGFLHGWSAYIILAFARLLAGVCGSTAPIAGAYISDVTEPEERASYMTYFQAALFGGLAFGPGIGAAIDHVCDFETACFASAVICVLNALMVKFLLPESKSAEERSQIQEEAGAKGAKMPRAAWAIFFASFLGGVGLTVFHVLGVLYIQTEFYNDLHPDMVAADAATVFFGMLITCVGVVGLVVNLFIYNRIVPVTGLKGALAFGGFFSVTAFFAIGIPLSKEWFFAWCMLMSFGENIMGTTVQTVITCVVDPSMFGAALGWMSFFQNLGRVIGPFVFAPLFQMHLGTFGIVTWSHSSAFFANSLFKLIAVYMCLSVRLLKPEEQKDKEAKPKGEESVEDSGVKVALLSADSLRE